MFIKHCAMILSGLILLSTAHHLQAGSLNDIIDEYIMNTQRAGLFIELKVLVIKEDQKEQILPIKLQKLLINSYKQINSEEDRKNIIISKLASRFEIDRNVITLLTDNDDEEVIELSDDKKSLVAIIQSPEQYPGDFLVMQEIVDSPQKRDDKGCKIFSPIVFSPELLSLRRAERDIFEDFLESNM